MRALVLVGLLVGCGAGGGVDSASDRAAASATPMQSPIHMSMHALHATGGTPPGWQLTPSVGDAERGKEAFVDYGCAACHVVAGVDDPGGATDESAGPELSGMGAHHPPAYFVEAILSPSAVLIEGDGWASAGGRSTMPAYPGMSIADLTDIVAFLGTLTTGGKHDHAAMMAGTAPVPSQLAPRPAPPESAATRFFVQRYDVQPDRLAKFEAWFAAEGRDAFFAYDGVVFVETYVDGGTPSVVTTVGFVDDETLTAFLNDPKTEALGEQFDWFIGPHGHRTYVRPPVYRASSLSASNAATN